MRVAPGIVAIAHSIKLCFIKGSCEDYKRKARSGAKKN